MELVRKKSIGLLLVNGLFLIALNIVLMTIVGYLTLDSNANNNSRVGACLLSFYIPFFIVFNTSKMDGIERMLKFGIGYIAYIILSIITIKVPTLILTGLGPCLIISLAVLFYGKTFLKKAEEK
jgi:hypothetical protein